MSLLRAIATPIARLPFMRMLAKENGKRLQTFGTSCLGCVWAFDRVDCLLLRTACA